jgi:hypothetical protein
MPAAGSARSGWPAREKWVRTDDDDYPVEGDLGEPLLDDVSEAGREEECWSRFVISPNAIRFAARI